MASPSKRRLEPKKRPDTLIDALASLDLNSDEEPMQPQEEIKRKDFAPKPDPVDPRFGNERFTVVIDDWSIDAISRDEFEKILNKIRFTHKTFGHEVKANPVRWLEKFKSYPTLFTKSITRIFPEAQVITMTQLEDILSYKDAVHDLDVRTVFVQFEWHNGEGHSWHLSHHRIKDLIFGFNAAINVPSPGLRPRDENKDGAAYGHLFMVRFVCSSHDRVHWRYHLRDSDLHDMSDFLIDSGQPVVEPFDQARSHITVSKRPFIVRDIITDEEPTERDVEINRDTVVSLLRYFYDKRRFFPNPNNDVSEPEWNSVNNAARALQEIIGQGLAEASSMKLDIRPPHKPWDHVSLEEELNQDAHDATVGFVRKNTIYDPRLLLLIWGFVYSNKTNGK